MINLVNSFFCLKQSLFVLSVPKVLAAYLLLQREKAGMRGK